MLYRYSKLRIYCKTHKSTQSADAVKALVTVFDLCPKPGSVKLNRYQSDMILSPFQSTSALSSVCWIGIFGPFCVEALVKWAIIPVGESDDDFWQNGAAARCQTIRVVAISSHGRTGTHADSHHKQAVSH